MTGAGEAVAYRIEPSVSSFEKLKPGPGRSEAEVAEHQSVRIRAAMLQLVSDGGYEAVTVRELARLAGVSSRTFYQRYSGKEECFLHAHELLVRRAACRISRAQAGETDWHESLRLTIGAYLDELQSDPRVARLLLVDAYAAGSVAIEQVRAAERVLEARMIECFELMSGQSTLPPQLARGIAVGLICTARSQLTLDGEPEFGRLTGELTNWAAAVFRTFEARSGEVSPLLSEALVSASASTGSPMDGDDRPHSAALGERGLIVAALVKLAAVEGYEELTVRKIRHSAGASRKKFRAHFEGVADCFQEAVDFYADGVISQLEPEQRVDRSSGWPPADLVTLLCKCVAEEAALATLCFADVLSAGVEGARGLERFLVQLSELLVASRPDDAETERLSQASAAAIWGVMREEILRNRQSHLPGVAPLLRILAAAPTHRPVRSEARIPDNRIVNIAL